jgi:hypothetical protein
MRNLSKNSLKKLMRPTHNRQVGGACFYSNYYFHNHGGARAWVQSKGKINNLTGHGCAKYISPAQLKAWQEYNSIK